MTATGSIPSEADQEKLRNLAAELRFLDMALQELQYRMGMVEGAMRELTITNMTLEGMETAAKDSEILIPMGGGSFVKGRITDTEKIILGVGAGVALEKGTKEARAHVEMQLSALQKAGGEMGQRYSQTIERMEALRREFQRLSGAPEG